MKNRLEKYHFYFIVFFNIGNHDRTNFKEQTKNRYQNRSYSCHLFE